MAVAVRELGLCQTKEQQITSRRFPPPWSVVEENAACFIVKDHAGKSLAYVYEDELSRRSAAKMLTRDEARRIAVNIAKLRSCCAVRRS